MSLQYQHSISDIEGIEEEAKKVFIAHFLTHIKKNIPGSATIQH